MLSREETGVNLPRIQVQQDEGALWSWTVLSAGGAILRAGDGEPTEAAARLRAATEAADVMTE